MGQRLTLGKDQRLKSRKRIERIFREGKSFNVFPYRVYYMLEDTAPAPASLAGPAGVKTLPSGPARTAGIKPLSSLQAGFGAGSRHFKKAVDRNRIKRMTREAYRLQKGALGQVVEQRKLSLSVFFVYTGKELPDYRLVSTRIGVALEKIEKELGS
ncbi:MAG TPA: ribonuclease P protein component [Puia sp.]|nr:ribonuclease P protein component [Puia sp.]